MKNETVLGHLLTFMTIVIWGTTFVSTRAGSAKANASRRIRNCTSRRRACVG